MPVSKNRMAVPRRVNCMVNVIPRTRRLWGRLYKPIHPVAYPRKIFRVVESDQHQVVYGSDSGGICFAVVTGLNYPSHVAVQMLQELYKTFMESYGIDARKGGENCLAHSKKTISSICKKYDDLDKVDKAASVLGKMDLLKSKIQDCIAGVLENTKQADYLLQTADELAEQAKQFEKKATEFKKKCVGKI